MCPIRAGVPTRASGDVCIKEITSCKYLLKDLSPMIIEESKHVGDVFLFSLLLAYRYRNLFDSGVKSRMPDAAKEFKSTVSL